MRILPTRPVTQALILAAATTIAVQTAPAQLTDLTQAPNTANEGIATSLEEQVGEGQGDLYTPWSSIFLIERDPFRAIRRGRQLFQRKFTVAQGLGPRSGDGVGNLDENGAIGAGLSDSCASCHGRPRGAAGFGGDVVTRPDSRDSPHLFGLGLQEMLADEITRELRAKRDQAIAETRAHGQPGRVDMRAKGIDFGHLEVRPDGSVDTSRLEGIDEDLRVRPFFAQGGTVSIREFVVGALNAEMGLQTFDPLLAEAVSGGRVVTPAGMVLDGALDTLEGPPIASKDEDGDNDGVYGEIDPALIDHFEFYLLNYFKPATGRRDENTRRGRESLQRFGCTSCHIADLRIENDRRVADVETVHDPERGVFNSLFATAEARFVEEVDDPTLPSLKKPSMKPFLVRDIFTDFKRHDLGPAFWERNFDGTMQKEMLTEPLWGVGTTPPYGHDGRSINLEEVILRHGGEARQSRDRFAQARRNEQRDLIAFLESLVLFPPDDTASNLNPGDPADPLYPQSGHGNIALGVLFNDPNDPE